MLTSPKSSDSASDPKHTVPDCKIQEPAPSALARIFLIPIWIWQKGVSPFIGHHCRFEPSCSEYSRQAFLRYGVLKGCWLSLSRIFRCHPFCKGGEDPLP